MTTIIIDPVTATIYSDSRGTYVDTGCFANSKKIHELGKGLYSCATGSLGTYDVFRKNFKCNATLPVKWFTKLGHVRVFIVSNNNGVIHVNRYEPVNYLLFSRFELKSSMILTRPMTAGSGANYAEAFLACGKTLEESIKLTATLDIATDGDVESVPILDSGN